jgi:hypothetical protein
MLEKCLSEYIRYIAQLGDMSVDRSIILKWISKEDIMYAVDQFVYAYY